MSDLIIIYPQQIKCFRFPDLFIYLCIRYSNFFFSVSSSSRFLCLLTPFHCNLSLHYTRLSIWLSAGQIFILGIKNILWKHSLSNNQTYNQLEQTCSHKDGKQAKRTVANSSLSTVENDNLFFYANFLLKKNSWKKCCWKKILLKKKIGWERYWLKKNVVEKFFLLNNIFC